MGPVELARAANEARCAGHIKKAQELFEQARAALPRVRGLEEAEVAALEATLFRDLMQYPSALECLAVAQRRFALHNRVERVAACEIQRGLVYNTQGDHALAFAEHARAARRLEPGHRLTVLAAFNMVLAMADAGNASAARSHFEVLRGAEVGLTETERRRVHWIEARILLAERRDGEALLFLREIATAFLREDSPLDTALAFIDLGEACVRLGRTSEHAAAAEVIADIFCGLGMERAEVAIRLMMLRMSAQHFSEAMIATVLTARRTAQRRGLPVGI